MNRINQLFAKKKQNILSIYFTAGYPNLHDTNTIITELEKNGVDLIEIGIPFSDPVADGPVIQESSRIALDNGMNLIFLFEQLRYIRKSISIPLVLMGYINPIFQMGMEKFLQNCSNAGIDGVIIPDLPVEVYIEKYQSIFKQHNIHFICLITPQSPESRIRFIDGLSDGFIYMVSTSATTGNTGVFNNQQLDYFSRIKSLGLKNIFLAGFGIWDHTSFKTACKYAGGAIIGSAFINCLKGPGNLNEKINRFISGIREK
jgi:tryptophan synthase alpha chain